MDILKTKPKVFLADLIHNQHVYNYSVPLNVACIAATLDSEFENIIDVQIFKFPDELLEAIKEKPDILALFNYDWNVNLNRTIIQIARKNNPEVFIVMGGPNIRCKPDGIVKWTPSQGQFLS